jgi:hypothetical protein
VADDKGAAPKPAEKPAEPPKPLESPKVDVTVTPKDGANRQEKKDNQQHAGEIKEKIEKEVKKQLDANKGGGAKKQLDAAEKVADDAKKGVDPKKIEKVKIKVEGEVDGDKVSREKTVTPKEGA